MPNNLTPAPMSAERLAEIRRRVKFYQEWQIDLKGEAVPAYCDRAALLAELDRHRAATAAELRGLLEDNSFTGNRIVAERNPPIYEAAARLGLTL